MASSTTSKYTIGVDTRRGTQNAKNLSTSFKDAARSAALLEGPLGGVAGRLSALSAIGGGFNLVMVAGAASIASVGIAALTNVRAFSELERQTLRAEALIKSTGGTAGLTAKQINELAESIDKSTLASAAGARDAAAALLTFQSVSGENFKRTLVLAQDLAAIMGGDMRGAAAALGRALEDPSVGLTLLTRRGISFTQSQKEMILAMHEAGDEMGAQNLMLSRLEQQLGGAGVGEAGGIAGKVDMVAFAWNKLKETMGDGFIARAAAAELGGFAALLDDANTAIENSLETQLQAVNQKLLSLGADPFTDRRPAVEKRAEGGIALAGEAIKAREVERLFELRGKLLDRDRERTAEEEKMQAAAEAARAARERQIKAEREAANVKAFHLRATIELGEELAAEERANDKARKALERQEATRGRVLRRLEEQINTLGMSTGELAAYELQVLGATEAQQEFAVRLGDTFDKLEKEQQALQDAERAAATFGGVLESAFNRAIAGGAEFSSILKGLIADLLRAGTSSDGLFDTLFGGGGGGGSSGIGGFFSSIFQGTPMIGGGSFAGVPDFGMAFASGGSILPSHGGSSDTQRVSFRKRPDERVDILTPAQQHASGGGGGVTVVQYNTINLDAGNAGFEGQIATAMHVATRNAVAIIQDNQRRNRGLTNT